MKVQDASDTMEGHRQTARGPADGLGGTPCSPRAYRVYGLCVRSRWPLPCLPVAAPEAAAVELSDGPAHLFAAASRQTGGSPARPGWFRHVRLRDGSDYLRWSRLFEFLVSADGLRIACRPFNGTPWEAFHAYLLGQALSFALIKRGVEPLHATAVVIGGGTVGFLGDCGHGKSTLAAAFLQAGYPLLTDDLLVVNPGDRTVTAYPGPPRIKLFPAVARRLLGEQIAGAQMNNGTRKLVIPLRPEGKRCWQRPSPLRAIYVLTPTRRRGASDRIAIRRLSPQQALVALLQSTFNALIVEPARLQRQFSLTARLARTIPVRSLSFPRRLARLPDVRAAVLADLMA